MSEFVFNFLILAIHTFFSPFAILPIGLLGYSAFLHVTGDVKTLKLVGGAGITLAALYVSAIFLLALYFTFFGDPLGPS